MLVRLDCLGCGACFAPGLGGSGEEIASANRLPDGAISTECRECNRTNVLERRGGQLVAVRLW